MEWQPIESAPKDGRHLIGWFPTGKRSDGLRQIGDSYAESIFWNGTEWSWVQDADTPFYQPTHWMPLPDPPQGA